MNSPYAFPHRFEDVEGMSLRDYFAGQCVTQFFQTGADLDYSTIAEMSYNMVDAMLTVREEIK